jgi:flavin-dependent dehydrogenase
LNNQENTYDLIILGGGLAASFLSLSLLKKSPDFKILIIEKSTAFPQKVGESLVDLTALYVNRLGIDHILERQTVKSGLRYLFHESNSSDLNQVAEFASPTQNGYIRGYHINRKVFDQDLLDEVSNKGVDVLRPADILDVKHSDFNNQLTIAYEGNQRLVHARWIVDATGRTRFLHKKLGWKDKSITLNTASIFAHFDNLSCDSLWNATANPFWEEKAIGPRKYSTTHLMRKNCWWWIIQLDDQRTSIGVVFDKHKVEFQDAETYFKEQIRSDAQLSIMTMNAVCGPVQLVDHLPYVSERIYAKGIALIGESGAFLDPLLGPGIELICQQTIWLSDLLAKDKKSEEFNATAWKKYSKTFYQAYDSRLKIYEAAYYFMGSFDLFTSFLRQGNYLYFSRYVFPSVVSPNRLKYPLKLNGFDRIAFKYVTWRFNRIQDKRMKQNRISKLEPNTLVYSNVRVPRSYKFWLVPLHLLFLSGWSYLRLEWIELKEVRSQKLEVRSQKAKVGRSRNP